MASSIKILTYISLKYRHFYMQIEENFLSRTAALIAVSLLLSLGDAVHSIQFVLQEVIEADGVRYSLQKYIQGISIPGCPWRQASAVFSETLNGVHGSGCWVKDAARGEITVWIETESGQSHVKSFFRNSTEGRPNGIIANIEKWHKQCQDNDDPSEISCSNRDYAVEFLRKDGWCWIRNVPTGSDRRWVRCK